MSQVLLFPDIRLSFRVCIVVMTFLTPAIIVLGSSSKLAFAQSLSITIPPEDVYGPGSLPSHLSHYERHLEVLRHIRSQIYQVMNRLSQRHMAYEEKIYLEQELNRLRYEEARLRSQLPPQLGLTLVTIYGCAAEQFNLDGARNHLFLNPYEIGRHHHLWIKKGTYDDWQASYTPPPPNAYDPLRNDVVGCGASSGFGSGSGSGSGKKQPIGPCSCTDDRGKRFTPRFGTSFMLGCNVPQADRIYTGCN